jgi:hypothetical protein
VRFFSTRGRSERLVGDRGSANPAGTGPAPEHFSVDEQPTMPMQRVRQRNDWKLLLAGLGGLVLIAAPVVVYDQVAGQGVTAEEDAAAVVHGGDLDAGTFESPARWSRCQGLRPVWTARGGWCWWQEVRARRC